MPVDTTVITTPAAQYRFTNQGAELIGVELTQYRALTSTGGNVELAREGESLLRYRLALPGDTIALDAITFRAAQTGDGSLTYHATIRNAELAITYTFVPDSYVVRVRGTVTGVTSPAGLLVEVDECGDRHGHDRARLLHAQLGHGRRDRALPEPGRGDRDGG